MLATYALSMLGHRCWRGFEPLTRDSRATQEQWLIRTLRQNQNTRFGRTHAFEKIRSLQDYRATVPIGDYEHIRPYVQRILEGERRVLTSEAPFMFNVTSGTTDKPKLIPVTRYAARMNAKLTSLWLYRTLVDHPRFLDRAFLFLASPPVEGYTASGHAYGSATGLALSTAPWLLKRQHAISDTVLGITDYESKYYLVMRFALEQRLSFIATPNPSTLLRLAETADTHKENLLRDIQDGTLHGSLDLPAGIRTQLQSGLRANPLRARELARYAEQQGALLPRDYWPDLRVIGCWKGGTLGVHLAKLNRWFRQDMPIRDLGYLASEAHCSLPISDRGAAGLLAIHANFYEFIPVAERDKADPLILTCDQLQTGESYHVLLTTTGGLYRYDINDVVRVAGYYHRTPLIEFLRKGRDMANLTGEKVHVTQLILAVQRSQIQAGLQLRHFRAIADAGQSRYEFMVEIEDPCPNADQLSTFLRYLDTALGQVNLEYLQKRRSSRLNMPCLHIMRHGWFERTVRRKIEQGARDTQVKLSLLTDAKEGTEDILSTIDG